MREPTQLKIRVQTASNRPIALSRFVTELADNIKSRMDATVEITSDSASSSSSEKNTASIDLNTLLITLAASGGVLTTLINLIKDRVTRDKTVTIEIDGKKLSLSGVDIDSEYTNRLIEEFIRTTTVSSKRRITRRKKHGKSN